MTEVAKEPIGDETVNIPVVLYTDGGCKPSKGRGGWGVHGQIGDEIYDGWGSFSYITTNNAAEVVAATKALTLAAEKGVGELEIRSDSSYMLTGIQGNVYKWRDNNWMRPDGTPVKNRKEWEDLVDANEKLKATDCSITWSYVKGHSGDAGNDAADRNASKGVVLSQRGVFEENITINAVKGYGKFKPIDYNRMLSHKRIYLPSAYEPLKQSKDGRSIYYCGTHGKIDELIGVRSNDAHHSVVFLKEAEPVVETIRSLQKDVFKEGVLLPVVIRFDNAVLPRTYTELMEDQGKHLTVKDGTYDLRTVDKNVLTENMTKALLSRRLIDVLAGLENRLEDFLAGNYTDRKGCSITNITDTFFELSDSKKPKTVLKKEIAGDTKYVDVKVKHKCGSKEEEVDLRLTLGADIASRNSLSRLAKEEPKVDVLTWAESEFGFRYAVIITTNEDAGIWCASYSNLRVLNKGGKNNVKAKTSKKA